MSWTATKPQPSEPFEAVPVRYATTDPQTGRMEARMAELDLAYTAEAKHLKTLITTAKQKLFASKKMQER